MFACTSCGVTKSVAEYRIHKRGYRIGKCRECEREYQREWSRKEPDKYRERKRESMARRRAADPDAVRAYQNAYHAQNRDVRTAKMRDYLERRFFWRKTMKLRGTDRATARALAAMWKSQRGKCALTGRRLDRSAQLDHKIPRARGGGDTIENLQWLCEEANLAKRALTDEEFTALCSDVMRWIGERIAAVEAMRKIQTLEAAE
jgi:5-methylcytosine-specific restriction endonuclease McrA